VEGPCEAVTKRGRDRMGRKRGTIGGWECGGEGEMDGVTYC